MITLLDYAHLMFMPVSAVQGIITPDDQSCGALSCSQIERTLTNLEWAESMIEAELNRYGCSLKPKQTTLLTDAPYVIPDGNILGKLETYSLTGTIVYGADNNPDSVTIDLSGEGVFDPDCDKVLVVEIENLRPIGYAPKLQPKWVQTVFTPDEDELLTLTATSGQLALVTCDGQISVPEGEEPIEMTFRIVILKPSPPRLTYIAGGCGCDPDESECSICGGHSAVNGCYEKRGATYVMRFDGIPCNCGGKYPNYEADLVKPAVEMTMAMANAIVSLANTRGVLDDCLACSDQSKERLKADLGIVSDGTDVRGGTSVYVLMNPFGINAPGALTAWKSVERVVSGVGGAGLL